MTPSAPWLVRCGCWLHLKLCNLLTVATSGWCTLLSPRALNTKSFNLGKILPVEETLVGKLSLLPSGLILQRSNLGAAQIRCPPEESTLFQDSFSHWKLESHWPKAMQHSRRNWPQLILHTVTRHPLPAAPMFISFPSNRKCMWIERAAPKDTL